MNRGRVNGKRARRRDAALVEWMERAQHVLDDNDAAVALWEGAAR